MLLRRRVIRPATSQYVLTVLFFGLLIGPVIAWQYTSKEERERKPFENRNLKKFPEIEYGMFWNHFRQLDEYYLDNFPFRTQTIEGHRRIMELQGRAPASWHCVLGHPKNWYFVEDSMPEFTGKNLLSEQQLAETAKGLRAFNATLKAAKIRLILVICPDKAQIYPEHLPLSVRSRRATFRRMDQVVNYLSEHVPDMEIIPLEKEMLKNKKVRSELLYYPNDTHWNMFGAYVGMRAIALTIDPSLQIPDARSVRLFRKRNHCGDLGGKCEAPFEVPLPDVGAFMHRYGLDKWMHRYGQDKSSTERRMHNPAAVSSKKILLLHDSFIGVSAPVFEWAFKDTVFYWVYGPRSTRIWGPKVSDILREKPDVVILECVERYLHKISILPPE